MTKLQVHGCIGRSCMVYTIMYMGIKHKEIIGNKSEGQGWMGQEDEIMCFTFSTPTLRNYFDFQFRASRYFM